MIRDTRFWLLMAVFQVLFGLAVFAITRDFYTQRPAKVSAHPTTITSPGSVWPQGVTESDITRLAPGVFGESLAQDPAELSRQADRFFSEGQYQLAANAYERLLTFDPGNAEIYNNLGLTLHYLGRSDEALRRLNEGIAVNAGNQRIWLTLGFVNSQVGNVEQARKALTTATETGSDDSIRQSAMRMLEALP
ncbi:MAG: tetratricopeptide repeat protein [Gammaproteobacteria bacterium]|nr:tetratricopeptide repeat protein [Gammaproteobacteria bacterium]MBT8111717.1 tetratricopeptide repeat protein [Gammaproteobacteria bacterium]NND47599.1 tetratricopeptide repeat protein [Woeseiaceae bacterium]NNL46415.1 tetratricopeptide repeat protein [Woeseiaceae bacterium]